MTPAPTPRPDVVFFMVDQLSARWLEAAVDRVCPTPNIDRLRARGVTFSHAFTSNPVCCPARATLATGLTTRGHGVLENGYELDPTIPTFMHRLQRGGWRTGAFGKVHFRPHFAGLRPDYLPYGFDVTHITEDPRGGEWLDWVEASHPEHYEAALATIWPTSIPEFAAYGPDKMDLRERIQAVRSRFKWATPEYPENHAGCYTLPFPEEVSQTCWITGHGVDFLRQTDPGQPLLAHISYVQPHGPSCPPASCMGLVDVDHLPEPAPAEWTSDPHAPGYFAGRQPVPLKGWRHARQCYFADIAHLDQQLGRVIDALEETGRWAKTYFFFLADHGDLLLDHGFRGKEERHYDACIRVPLIVAGPGLGRGATCDALVQLEDICPTVLEAAGLRPEPMPKEGPYLKLSAEAIPVLPGRSLLPLCRGETPSDWRQDAYCESYNAIWSIDPGDWARTVRTADYRYTLYPNGNGEQFFHLRDDPQEQRNLCADPAAARIRQDLRDRLLERVIMQDHPKTRRDLYALGVH